MSDKKIKKNNRISSMKEYELTIKNIPESKPDE